MSHDISHERLYMLLTTAAILIVSVSDYALWRGEKEKKKCQFIYTHT